MKRVFLIIFIGIMLTACGTKVEQPNGSSTNATTDTVKPVPATTTQTVAETKVSDYFAYAKDTHMVFKGTGNEYAGYETYVDYLKDNTVQVRNMNGGAVTISVFTIKDGALKKVFSPKGETYYLYDYTSSTNMDEILIKEPIKVGTSWALANGDIRSITAIDKQVKTPLSDYTALEITTKSKDSTVKDYYVKNIGRVKSEYSSSDGSMTVMSELEKIEKGVPYKQTIRLYFPEFSKDRVVFIDREINTNTNEDMKSIFQKEIKTIPENSELANVLSPNTVILSIVVDDEKETVTVDFSSQLIKEMNAGSTFESMLIKSITNTFGNYYQKSKVIITVEGKPYESGHFAMKPGEYFTVKTDDVKEFGK